MRTGHVVRESLRFYAADVADAGLSFHRRL